MGLLIVFIIIASITFYVIGLYNQLQTLKTQIRASIQEIGNQLKRQAELIPNLTQSVKGFLKHEKGVFDALTSARTQADAAAKNGDSTSVNAAIDQLSAVLPKLQVLVEDNPELKSNESVDRLMRELTDTSDKVMYARRSLIDLTQRYNQLLVVFPSNVIANLFGFKTEEGLKTPEKGAHLEVSSSEMNAPKIEL